MVEPSGVPIADPPTQQLSPLQSYLGSPVIGKGKKSVVVDMLKQMTESLVLVFFRLA